MALSMGSEHLHDFQSETDTYGHESRGKQSQEWLSWRGPATICPALPYPTLPEPKPPDAVYASAYTAVNGRLTE
jgi:hypothetical protein